MASAFNAPYWTWFLFITNKQKKENEKHTFALRDSLSLLYIAMLVTGLAKEIRK